MEPPEAFPAEPRPPASPSRHWALAGLLLALTWWTTTTLGAFWSLPVEQMAGRDEILPWLSPATVLEVWRDPELLRLGLAFSLPLLFILLSHELGHYLTCRRYGLRVTPPFFIPAPFAFGTLGAFIRIRSPIPDKRQLFDVGVAGPIAGFVALLPFLLLGVAWSRPVDVETLLNAVGPEEPLPFLGSSLGLSAAFHLFHGELPPSQALEFHPFAMAAWIGLLATALNLIPLGQLDGGHLLYAVLGRRHRQVAPFLWVGLLAAGLLFWPGWLVWAALTAVLGLRHPPVWDEEAPLGPGRKALAVVALLLLAASFMPVPVGFYLPAG